MASIAASSSKRSTARCSEHDDIGETDAVCRQHAGEWMHENRKHPQRVRDHARVLPGRAAEACERVLGDVMPALDGNLLDRVRHVLDGDAHAPSGDAVRRLRDAGGRFDL